MMFDWLSDMVEEGLDSKTAAVNIMNDCREIAKDAMSPEAMDKIKELGMGAAGGVAMFGVNQLMNMGMKHYHMRADVGAMKKVKAELHADPMLGADKGKTDARFLELVRHAPAIATDSEKAKRIIKKHFRNGFSDADIEKLQNLQMMAMSSASDAGATTSFSEAMKYEKGVKDRMMKSASAPMNGQDAELLGHVAYDVYSLQNTFEKNANIFKRFLAKGKEIAGRNQRLADIAAVTALMTGASAATAAAAGAASHVKDKIDQKNFNEKLEQSYMTALKEAPKDSILRDRPHDARKAFETLVHFSPNIAAEPRAAQSFMNKMLAYEQIGVEPSDIKDLVEIERNYRQSNSKPSPFFSAFSSTGKMLGLDKSINQGMSAATKPYADAAEQATRQELGLPSQFDTAIKTPDYVMGN